MCIRDRFYSSRYPTWLSYTKYTQQPHLYLVLPLPQRSVRTGMRLHNLFPNRLEGASPQNSPRLLDKAPSNISKLKNRLREEAPTENLFDMCVVQVDRNQHWKNVTNFPVSNHASELGWNVDRLRMRK